ncbi:MAG TPA: DMT family transporter [Steroidobacteraceae bacterium]|nr:DMT family transporter [Steroidobacteraceae bacterium]
MPTTNLRGISSMLAAVTTFAVMDVLLKTLSEDYPAMQVTFLRGIASLPLLLAANAMFGRWRDLIAKRWHLHVMRGLLSVMVLWCFVYAVSQLSLANAYSIFMSAPLLITALSVPILRERVGWQQWLAIFVGLTGVIIVLKPTGAGLVTIGGLAALASAAGYAISAITIRILTRTDSSAATVFWTLFFLTIISGAVASMRWVPVQWDHWYLIAGLGISGALGQYFMTEAFRLAPPPVVAPLEYTALAWGMLFDWLLWATAPGLRMLAGAFVIVASGIYIIHRERFASAALQQQH